MQSSSSSNEIVYGGTSMMSGSDESHVMSEKVQMIASSIYKEFESMIQKHGQDSIKELMALVVNVLESLDVAYLEKEELAVDLEMLKEENEQLLNQYERERQMRKNQDQKCLEIEETMTEQNRDLESKVESMASIVRMLELRAKNASDHANRLEEREADQKIEYEKLHERYNELLRTHIEHVERTKFLMGAEMFDMAQSLPINNKNNKNSMAMSAIDTNVRGISDLISAVHMSQSTHVDLNLANHISNERDWHEEFGNQQSVAEILANCASPHVENEEDKTATPVEKLEEAHEEENDGKKEDKLVPNDEGDGISLGADLTGMGKEVENLIRENTELLETKNALNIVKNDLIARVDQLSSEQEVYREEVRSLELVKLKLSERIREMEAELRELREKVNQADVPEEQEDRSQGKRFTRIEMARMVMEKNQYKEKFLELQETVKYTELKRAKKQEEELAQRRNRSIWGFFSSLLGESTTTPASSARHPPYPQKKGPAGTRKPYNTSPVISKKTRTCDIDMDLMKEKRKAERRQHYQTVSQHMKKEDFPNAYGWSMSSNKAAESMAVPVNCRPLLEQFSSLKIWCAASTALHGGLRNGEYIVGDSLSNCDPHFFRSRRRESRGSSSQWAQSNGVDLLESSLVWVCCLDEQRSVVAVLEASQPTNVLECFEIDAASVLCISTVAGVHEADTRIPPDEGLSPNAELCTKGGYLDAEKIQSAINGSHETFGAVEFIATKKLDDGGGVPTYAPAVEMLSPKRRRDFSTGKSEPSTEGEDNSVKARVDSLPLHIRDSLKLYEDTQEDDIFTVPTMWIGLENYFIHIYSAVQNWRRCLRRVQMPDAVLSILHLNGRVFAALANGAIAVFHRDTDGNWSEKGYHIVRLGAATNSVCHLCVVDGKVWAAYRNCVVVLDPVTLRIDHVIVAHPRKDSQVRQMISCGNGVWLSIRLDSCIRLFHAQTFQHLQDIDVEPFITKMLGTNKLDFLHLRITSLYALDKRIWLGTGSGLILSIPLKEEEGSAAVTDAERGKTPGQAIRVMNSEGGDRMVGEATNVPYCDITNAQLSFHGHKDAVRFLLPVLAEGFSDLTESVETKKVLVISGGDGYIDFRLGEESDALKMQSVDSEAVENMKEQIRARDLTHLLIWETECPMN